VNLPCKKLRLITRRSDASLLIDDLPALICKSFSSS
jgi:hypothetical protein